MQIKNIIFMALQLQSIKIKQKDISFIEIKHSQPLMQEIITVDIENKKGARMRICLKETDIAPLVKLFLSL